MFDQYHTVTFLLLFLLAAIPVPSQAGMFGPSNFEDCVLEGLKTAKTDFAVRAVAEVCRDKFPYNDKTRQGSKEAQSKKHSDMTQFEKQEVARSACKMSIEEDVNGDVFFAADRRPSVASAIRMLKSIEFSSDYGSVSFQNNSPANIKHLVFGFLEKNGKTCLDNYKDYKAILSCGMKFDNTGVGRGVYGTLPCDPKMKKFSAQPYCVVGLGPGFSSSDGAALTAYKLGWCN